MLEQETGTRPCWGICPTCRRRAFASRHLGLLHGRRRSTDLAARHRRAGRAAGAERAICRACWRCAERRTADGAGRERTRRPGANAGGAHRRGAGRGLLLYLCGNAGQPCRAAGAELVFFSPVHDAALPAGSGWAVSAREAIRSCTPGSLRKTRPCAAAVRRAVEAGLPTVAECGGFLYLGQEHLTGDRRRACTLWRARCPARARRRAEACSLRLRAAYGPRPTACCCARAKRSPFTSSTIGTARKMARRSTRRSLRTGRSWTCGFAGPALYAAFPHLYFAGRPQLAERFVRAAAAFQSGR